MRYVAPPLTPEQRRAKLAARAGIFGMIMILPLLDVYNVSQIISEGGPREISFQEFKQKLIPSGQVYNE